MTDEPIVGDISVDLVALDREEWQEAVQEALMRIEASTASSEKVVLRQQIAAIYESHLDAPEAAFAQLAQAFIENPMNKQTVENLERLADNLDKWQELVSISTTALHSAPGRHAQVQLCLKIGDWCSEKLGQLEHAFGFYRSALDKKPDHIGAYLKLAGLYRRTEQWADLADVLAVAAANCGDSDRAKDFLFERGVIFEQHLNALDLACQAFEQALEIDSKYVPALDVLERIYHARGEWWQRVATLKRKLELAEDAETVIALRQKIAEILKGDGDDTEGAADQLKQILKIDPSNLETLRALESLYLTLDKNTKAKEILERLIEHTLDAEEKIALMERLASMLGDRFSEWDKAAHVLEQVLEIDSDHSEARDELEKIYTRKQNWPKLAQIVEHKLERCDDKDQQVELYLKLAQIQGPELKEWEQARCSYEKVLEIEPDNRAAIDGVSEVLLATEQWSDAVEALKSRLAIAENPEKQKEILHRLGIILTSRQQELDEACGYFQRALAIDKDHLPTLQALRTAYIDLEQWSDAAELLKREHSLTESRIGKAKLCYELGCVYEKMEDLGSTQEWYERAIECDPYNQPAAEALAEIYQAAERHQDAEPLLEMLIRLGSGREDFEKHRLYHMLSVTKDALGKTEEHLEAARKAKELGSQNADFRALMELVRAAHKNEKYHEAVETCRLIVKNHLENLTARDQSEMYYRLGYAHLKLNQKLKAQKYLERSLEMDDTNRETLDALIELCWKQKKHDDAVKYKSARAHLLEGEERYLAFVDLGEVCQQRLKDNGEAIKALENALLVKPKDRPVLHKLLALYQAEEKWTEVIEAIEIIKETEEDPIRLSRLHYTLGVVWRDKLQDTAQALDNFNLALDLNPDDEETFKVVIAIVAKDKDWHEIVRNYQWMLDRLEGRGNASFEASLQHALGEVYLYRLENHAAAALAFESAVAIHPDNLTHHDRLASAYFRMEDHANDAIDKYRQLINMAPDNIKYYRRLGALLSGQGRHDEAWCVSSALVFMGQATGEEKAFYERYRPTSYPAAKHALPLAMWSTALSHPDDNENIAEIFAIVGPAIAERAIQPLKAYGVHKKDLVTRTTCEDLDKIAHYTAGTLGIMPMPELYVKKDDTSAFSPILTKTPASVCGDRFLEVRSQKDILFSLTKHLTYYRRGRRIRWILPTSAELRAVLGAAVKFGDTSYKLGGTKTQIIFHYVDVLKELLSSEQQEQLKNAAKRFVAANESSSIKKWMEGLEYTACRTALLILGDLVKIVPLVRAERGVATGPTINKKVLDLQLFSVSKQYAELRETLGITIDYKE